MQAIEAIDLKAPGAPALVMRDLSEYVTLPFLAAFDVPELPAAASSQPARSRGPQKRVTYIGLSRKTMPQLVDLFLSFKEDSNIYNDGTVESLLSVSKVVRFTR